MTASPKTKSCSPEEYLALEEKAEFRSAYSDGEIIATAGGSLNHARIIRNIDRNVSENLDENCESITSEVKLHAEDYR